MPKTIKTTHFSGGILRIRLSEAHGETLAERYGILTLPTPCEESGITVSQATESGVKVTLPGGRELTFVVHQENTETYTALHDSLCAEFAGKFTDYQAIVGTPPQTETTVELADFVPEAAFACTVSLSETEKFYGMGEGANDRIELRGRAYQNWVRYQYNEIPIPLCLSNEGWGVWLNARARSFFDVGGRVPDQLILLGEDDELDLFLLTGTLPEMLHQYTTLTGKPMLLPKWAYGLTYIAPIFATQHDVLTHAERFRKEHIPCDMFSLEPGWMTKFYDYGTDKQWDIRRFHVTDYMTPARAYITFIGALKRYGFHLSLWLCIRHDLTAEAERALVNGEPDQYGEAWYTHLQKFTAIGVDGYKLDPADMVCCFDRMNRPRLYNGLTTMQMHNYNQILLTRQMYEGFAKQENKRPMHHYCGGYSGIQKWSGATTGDNGGELGAMIWLETLALSGHMNTTIDMNIHFPESVHFGFFVPWAHLNAWHGAEQPWYAGDDQHVMFATYARLRYRILPYIYSTAIEGHETALPMIRPMPMAFPEDEAVCAATRQYMFGENLLVTAYADTVHLPAGRWTDAWTGAEYEGPCDMAVTYPAGRGGGLYIRGGAVIPSWSDRDYITQKTDETITLDIYPAPGTGVYHFREDDGVSLDYETTTACVTEITVTEDEDGITVQIGDRVGTYTGKPAVRCWEVRVHPFGEDKAAVPVTLHNLGGDTVTLVEADDPVALFHPDATDVLRW